ncbi:unnamed protein product [Ectocarpus sp. CCAP 1310/34]|nr:unnamed protein product [Ectocarpus sp. CCAP 1310/34]
MDSSSGSGEESESGSNSSLEVVEVRSGSRSHPPSLSRHRLGDWQGDRDATSSLEGSEAAGGLSSEDSNSDESSGLSGVGKMGLGSRASPRSSRRPREDGGADGLSSPESQSSASSSLGATPSPRRSNRRLSPRRRNTEDGYLDLIGGRAVQQGGKETKGGSGASFTSPLNLASSQEEGGTGEGGGDDGQQAGPSVSGGDEEGGPRVGAKKTKSRSKTKGKGSARLEGVFVL